MFRNAMRFVPALAGVLLSACALAAARPQRNPEKIWTAADAARGVRSVAMLPPASYDHKLEAENLAGSLWGQAIRDAGYRWVSPNTARALIQAQAGDSALGLLQAGVLANGRCDSVLARTLASATRTSALLTLRVDRWDQNEIEWNQAGKPSTTVQITAALVDSTGRLLWSASGSETGEGPYHDPNANVIGVKSGDLGSNPLTGQGGPPAYAEVLTRLYARWSPQFPRLATAAADTTHAR